MFRDFSRGLFSRFLHIFSWPYLGWHALAISLTAVLVLSDFDWWYFEFTRGSILLAIALPAAIIGFFVPILLSVGLYTWGRLRKNQSVILSAIAVAQAGILGWIVSSLYKAFTGRIQPEFYTHLSNVDISHQFNFGFLQHGIFWGWPSSHTAVAFAMSTALVMMYPKSKVIRYLAPLYALYIGVGVSVSIHWFSDFIAGAIIGTLIGYLVAKSFRTIQ